MKYPKACPKCNTEFNRNFWKNALRESHASLIYCPKCRSVINPLVKGFQNFFVTSQFLSVTLIPCDDKFSPQQDKKVEIQNNFVHKVEIDAHPYGCEGTVEFRVPVKFYATKLFEFFTKRNPVMVQVSFSQVKLGEDNVKVQYGCSGIVESCGADSIEQTFDGMEIIVDDPKASKDALLYSCRNMFKVKFVDPLKYFLSKSAPFMVYMKKSYSDIFKTHLDDCGATAFVKAEFDQKFKEMSKKLDFIATPFVDPAADISLYDFWLNTIRSYGGYLMMKPDGSYSISKAKELMGSKNPDVDKYDKPFVKKLRFRQNDRYNTGLNMYNAIYKEAKAEEVKSNNSDQSQAKFTTSMVMAHNYPSIFKIHSDFEGNRLTNDFSVEHFWDIEFNGLPYNIPLYPSSQIAFTAKNWGNFLGDKDFKVNIVDVHLCLEVLPEHLPQIDGRNEQDIDDKKLTGIMAPQKQQEGMRPFLACSATLVCENAESLYSYLPEFKVPEYPLRLQGVVVVPNDVSSKYDSKSPYLIFDGSSNNPASQNTNSQTSSSNDFSLNMLPEHYFSYHVEIPVYEQAGAKGKVIIAALYRPNIISDQFFLPFPSQQPVVVEVHQEYAILTDVLPQYTLNTNIDKSKQVNAFTFGPEQQGQFNFTVDSGDETLLLKKVEKKAGTIKTLSMTNDSFMLSFEESKE